ncbi:MAG: hypothetical protein ACLR6J_11360 [Parabacteroides merdae]
MLSSAFTSGSLEIKKDEMRPAYMQVAKEGSELGIAIRLKKITEDKEKTYKIPTPLSIERRQNIRLIFKTDGEALDGIGLEIILDDEMTNVTLNEGIPDFMWKPFEKPTLSPDDFTNGESFTIKVGKFEESYSWICYAGRYCLFVCQAMAGRKRKRRGYLRLGDGRRSYRRFREEFQMVGQW